MPFEKFPEILRVLALPLWSGKEKLGLDLPERLLAELGNPQDKLKVLHIAGTNGKGSTAALIAAMLYAAGNKVAQFLSPHLTNICERCLIDGKPIEASKLERAFCKIRSASEKLGLEPSFFVYTHLVAIICALEERVDYLILEAGVGGRLDSTNVLKNPVASVITGVALDHTNILGESEYLIAREKAGIFKKGSPAFAGLLSKEARLALEEIACDLEVTCEFLEDIAPSCFENLEFSRLRLLGEHQRANARLAARVAMSLGLSLADVQRGLEICRFPGRLESVMFAEKEVLLDIAHNQQGVEVLCRFLEGQGGRVSCADKFSAPCLVFLISILDRKDADSMLRVFAEMFPSSLYVFTEAPHPNAISAQRLAERFVALCEERVGREERVVEESGFEKGGVGVAARVFVESDWQLAFSRALSLAGAEGLADCSQVVVSGSLFLVSVVRALILGDQFSSMEE